MYIMLNYTSDVPEIDVAAQRCWHPANILEPDLAFAINSLARLVDRINWAASITDINCESTVVQSKRRSQS